MNIVFCLYSLSIKTKLQTNIEPYLIDCWDFFFSGTNIAILKLFGVYHNTEQMKKKTSVLLRARVLNCGKREVQIRNGRKNPVVLNWS